MNTLNIEEFDPTAEHLRELVANSSKITSINIDDKIQMEVVKRARIDLKNARVAITKRGKEMREEALSFQKAVISKEKELVAIIEPEEARLTAIEDEAKEKAARQERAQKLPWRKQQLADADHTADDETLLGMDDKAFDAFLAERIAVKQEREAEERRRIEQEEQRKRDIAEAEARAKSEAEQKAKRDAEDAERRHQEEIECIRREQEAKERAEAERTEREARETAEKERRAKEEAERLAKQVRFQEWLSAKGYSESTKADFILKDKGDTVELYKLVGVYEK